METLRLPTVNLREKQSLNKIKRKRESEQNESIKRIRETEKLGPILYSIGQLYLAN